MNKSQKWQVVVSYAGTPAPFVSSPMTKKNALYVASMIEGARVSEYTSRESVSVKAVA